MYNEARILSKYSHLYYHVKKSDHLGDYSYYYLKFSYELPGNKGKKRTIVSNKICILIKENTK